VWHAERAIEANAALLQKIDAVALAAVRNELAILKQAWPAASPPARPVKTHAEVLADIARVELAAGPYLYGSK
ncbi:MAG: hypothetical protein RLZ98_3374, partial [Pseudomonadota bacterium]